MKARAAGIYLIFAAQRPDANVMPMQLRSNLGNRLILRVETEGTSEIALGEMGGQNGCWGRATCLQIWRAPRCATLRFHSSIHPSWRSLPALRERDRVHADPMVRICFRTHAVVQLGVPIVSSFGQGLLGLLSGPPSAFPPNDQDESSTINVESRPHIPGPVPLWVKKPSFVRTIPQ